VAIGHRFMEEHNRGFRNHESQHSHRVHIFKYCALAQYRGQPKTGSINLDAELDEEQCEFTQVVETATNHLFGILNDVLDFSKIKAGKLTLRPALFKPVQLGNEIIKLFLPQAGEKNISLTLTLAPTVPEYLNGDAGRLRQVLSNFVSNAIKFTETDGHVSIHISSNDLADDICMLTCRVQDSGKGIPKSLRPTLFEPFTQADPSNTRKHGGAGLGLAISKRLVELMKGKIGFESSEGKAPNFGLTFHFPAT